jgi:hypothetical protein
VPAADSASPAEREPCGAHPIGQAWVGRFALEARGGALRAAADALDACPDRPDEAMGQLQYLCVAHGVA